MLILAFDSTAKAASVAISDNDRILAEYTVDNGLTQSELLLPMAESLLSSLKLSFSDVDAYAAAVGPGSFTGVRIGASLVKGLAFGRNIPCIEVSTLEALAENLAPLPGLLVPCMDARRGQVYNAVFRIADTELCRQTPDRAISLDELADELKDCREPIYLSGDGAFLAKRHLEACGIKIADTPPLLINQNAASVARVAYRKYLRGEWTSDEKFAPSYLRLPQAERERLEREASQKNN